MKPPKKLALGGLTYDVVTDPARIRREEHDAKCHLLGLTTAHKQMMHLCPDQPPGLQRVTLLHETLHVLLTDLALEEEQEELIVRIIARGLTDALRSNPQLTAFLTEKDA